MVDLLQQFHTHLRKRVYFIFQRNINAANKNFSDIVMEITETNGTKILQWSIKEVFTK